MAPRKKAPTPQKDPEPPPARPGLPVRLLPHDWPFLYSVLANGDLVINQRLAVKARPRRQRTEDDTDDALM